MNSVLLQILVVNAARMVPPRAKPSEQFEVQDAECCLCNPDGTPLKVGVLRLSEELRKVAQPGFFLGDFSLDVHWKDRQIGAVLTSLRPVNKTPNGFVAAAAAVPAKS